MWWYVFYWKRKEWKLSEFLQCKGIQAIVLDRQGPALQSMSVKFCKLPRTFYKKRISQKKYTVFAFFSVGTPFTNSQELCVSVFTVWTSTHVIKLDECAVFDLSVKTCWHVVTLWPCSEFLSMICIIVPLLMKLARRFWFTLAHSIILSVRSKNVSISDSEKTMS